MGVNLEQQAKGGCVAVILVVAVVSIALIISYALAKAGEPQSHWLWCTVLGAC